MALQIGSVMPPLQGAVVWLNEPEDWGEIKASPILIQFWAISCPLCKLNIPFVHRLLKSYEEVGLRLFSVHMPRVEADTDVGKVKAAVAEMGLVEPCAIDNAHTLGDSFQTGGVWPCYFLFDAGGRLRSRAAGAMGLKMAENSRKRLLELKTPS